MEAPLFFMRLPLGEHVIFIIGRDERILPLFAVIQKGWLQCL